MQWLKLTPAGQNLLHEVCYQRTEPTLPVERVRQVLAEAEREGLKGKKRTAPQRS